MTETTPLALFTPATTSEAGTAVMAGTASSVGQHGAAADTGGRNEGSFLDFLNAFTSLSSAEEGLTEGALPGGSSLPLAAQAAESGHLKQPALSQDIAGLTAVTDTSLPASAGLTPAAETSLAAAAGTVPAIETSGIAQAAQSQAAGNQALSAQNQLSPPASADEHGLSADSALSSQLPGEAGDTPQEVTDLSAQVSSAALASRLVGLAQEGVPAQPVAAVASPPAQTETLEPAPVLNPSGTTETVPSTTAQAAHTPAAAMQLSGRTQFSTKADGTGREQLTRADLITASPAATTASTSSDVEMNAAIMQNIEPALSETDAYFAAQVKKLVTEQQGGQSTHTLPNAAALHAGASDPVSASAIRAGTMQSVVTAETGVPVSHQATIAETFGRPDWNQGMGKQVLWMANQNIRTAELRLNPAHLGPIEVRIEMEDDQINLAFTSRNAVVREAVEQAMPRLREMFEESGLNLADTDVSQQSFAEQRSQQAADYSNHRAGSFPGQADPVSAESTTVTEQVRAGNAGLVDYYI